MTTTDRSSQLLKGVLDMCLLAVIAEEPSYGYEMVRKLEDRGLALVSEGSVYPLLSRLQRQGLVESFVQESSGGPPRKYYRIAAAGRERLGAWIDDWRKVAGGVDRVIGGGDDA
ncbi:MAG TPA: PadR family transcriptional regulator [Acidimicrobiia bacterium]|nr:PadR family transcriptional regulator [Acidimicrobiia bacterium]